MTKLKIATDLSLPIEAVTEAMGFLGRRGSGKTYAAQRLAEEFHRAKAQFVVLDPVGNWWALRLAADGESPGIPVPVFGGLHGDVPLEPVAGKLIADTIVDRGISAVIDVSQFESDADKARFARAFAERFYYRKKSAPSAVHLFLEEAQEFIPQNPTRDEPLMLHAFTRLAKLGRNFGIGISMLSQRPQEVNKKVINLAELLLVFQLTGVHERKAVEAWISDKGIDGEDIEAELPKLERGHPHAWSPAWLGISRVIDIHEKWTFDASSTPKSGTATVARELSPIDLEKLRTDMASAIERAKLDDPKELRKEIAELRKQLAAKGNVTDEMLGSVKADEYFRGQQAGRHEAMKDLKAIINRDLSAVDRAIAGLMTANDVVVKTWRSLQERLEAKDDAPNKEAFVKFVETKVVPSVRRSSERMAEIQHTARRQVAEGDGKVSPVAQRILDTIAGFVALGVDTPDKVTVAALNGYGNLTSKGFANAIGTLRSGGYIEYPSSGRIALTDAGRAIANNALPVDSLDELHEKWIKTLGGQAERILTPLIQSYPNPMAADEVASIAGYGNLTSKGFANMRGRLRTLGLIDYPSPGNIVATDLLFPKGLR